MSNFSKRLAYAHDKFVDRTGEVQLVLDKVERLLAQQLSRRRTVIFHGQRGTGKSWLLQEIDYQLQDKANALALYLDLAVYVGQTPGDAVRAAIRHIHQSVAANLQATSDLDQLAEWLVADVRQMEAALVLLLDHVDESSHKFLAKLDDHLLAPLSNVPRVMLVLAGRGRGYPWKSPELRLRACDWDLDAFSLADTQIQLQRQIPAPVPKVRDIQHLSAGYPWTNYLLARSSGPKWAQVLDQIADQMLVGHHALRPYLEALCVLRFFDESRMAEPLANYPPSGKSNWNYSACRVVREKLVGAALVRWTRNGYAIDEALRTVLEAYLFRHDVDLWVHLHCTSFSMFERWATCYGTRWRNEADYHAHQLARTGFNSDDCSHPPSLE